MQAVIQSPTTHRLPENPNLRVYSGTEFRGLPLLKTAAPFILEHLERTYDTIEKAVHQYSRVLAIRFDLRYPAGLLLPDELMTNMAISKFVESLKAKIVHNRHVAKLKYERVHDTVIRYVWAREFDQSDTQPHYHFLLLLNRHAFHTLGNFNSENQNLYKIITEAWASALGLPEYECKGLVHVPENACYAINMNRGESGLPELFKRASYLCKVDSKRFGDGCHVFGSSHI